ncbi:PorP/SprF family type IX secretion system membrane protein [Phaeodactylibacter luteus]|uniref:Type IX secretion system membrane protein PorP/SprF n=1 Tax=Phaeodactylibacter luteus TaxID=1564516 RepID=A0A5C6RJ02_9BACT|nr:PorP/SprF family type IX secretion system membrane protein [Phaeodactylibacter luteus]TXB61332.1 type IX secretion system membrane protein PorP/SprF [Phaeodactylibacter luteus]
MKRVTTCLSLLACLVFGGASLQAQQLSLFTQYRENATVINPASMESDFLAFGQNITFGGSYRAQWVGLDNAPTTQTLRGSYVNSGGSGVSIMTGGYLINDQTGPTGFTGAYGRIAGVLSPNPEESGFVVGLSAGAVNFRVDASQIRLREEGDVVGTADQSQFFPDLGLGLYYYSMVGRNDNMFYAGLSVPQVFGLDLTFQNEAGEYQTKRVQHYYGMLGFYAFFNNDSFLEPSLWVKYTEGAPFNADFNLRYYTPVNFWVGAGGSTAGTAHLETGVVLGDVSGFDNTFRIGYGFDYSFSSFGPTAGSTHEINLTMSLYR